MIKSLSGDMHSAVRLGGRNELRAAPLLTSRCRKHSTGRRQPSITLAAAQSSKKSFIARWAEGAGLKTSVTLEDFTGDR